MAVIVLCSTKGGVGKSTIAMVLAQTIAAAGQRVSVIDADPNQPLATWADRAGQFGNKPDNLSVIGGVNEDTIVSVIDEAAAKDPFVIVDLEGSGNVTATYAIGRSDLVLIPMRGKQLDADQAGKVIGLINRGSAAFRRQIPYRVVLSMTSALMSREHKHIFEMLSEREIPILSESLPERAAYSAIFQLGGTLFDLKPGDVSNTAAAIDSAKALTSAVILALKEGGQ